MRLILVRGEINSGKVLTLVQVRGEINIIAMYSEFEKGW